MCGIGRQPYSNNWEAWLYKNKLFIALFPDLFIYTEDLPYLSHVEFFWIFYWEIDDPAFG